MHRLGPAPWFIALVLLAAPAALRAEEAPEPVDLVDTVRVLRRSLQHYETPAPRTERVTALHDAWSAILRPRAARMTSRLTAWEKADRWIRPEDGDLAIGLKPEQWPAFVRDMATLAAELKGAWTQYGSVELRGKQTSHGMAVLPRPPRLDSGYRFPTPDRRVVIRTERGNREDETTVTGAPATYPVLLAGYRSGWLSRQQRREEYFQWWRRQEEAHRRTFEDLQHELDHTRTSLAEDLAGLKTIIAALQRIEEERLESLLGVHPQGETLEAARHALRELGDARTAAETYDGRTPAKYGALLRDWLRHRTAAKRVLAKPAS